MILSKEFWILDFGFWIRSENRVEGRRTSYRSPGLSTNPALGAAIAMALFSLLGCSKDPITPGESASTANQSAYIAKVFDYQYGPGQHASLISPTAKGSDFVGEPLINNKSFTFLGGWGGYLIAGFDHAVMNTNGPDIAIYTQPSVSSEPGVVFVMVDNNNDGIPNDGAWYEIKGSEYDNPETIHNYQVTYYKIADGSLVSWMDNQGNSGMLVPESGTINWWWSGYGDKTAVTFRGVKLPDAYVNSSKDPLVELWVQRSGLFRYGYAECYDNVDYNTKLKANFLDISSAVDMVGNPVNLTKISFIKVQSGVLQRAGWLNEISTEISGAADIHLLDKKSYQ